MFCFCSVSRNRCQRNILSMSIEYYGACIISGEILILLQMLVFDLMSSLSVFILKSNKSSHESNCPGRFFPHSSAMFLCLLCTTAHIMLQFFVVTLLLLSATERKEPHHMDTASEEHPEKDCNN